MPPRFAYWTILIDNTPTAFRAREREELQPTFVQLQRKNANVTMQWFARGKLWASREAEREDFQMQKHAPLPPRDRDAERPPSAERRGSDWRPGGTHKDPRDRFKKKNRPERAWSEKDPATQREFDKPGWKPKPQPWTGKPAGPPRGDRPPARHSSSTSRPSGGGWRDKPAAPTPNDRPWQTKPTGPRAQRKPWVPAGAPRKPWENKPAGGAPRGDRPWSAKPPSERKPWTDKPSGERKPWSGKPADRSGPARERKPWDNKPAGGPPRGDRPWTPKPPGARKPWENKSAGGPPRGDRPWSAKPPGARKPWQDKPAGGPPRGDRPWAAKPLARRSSPDRRPSEGGRKRRDDDPDKD